MTITNNEFNPSNGHAIDIRSGNTNNVLIQDNTVVGGDDAIMLTNVDNFEIDNNDIGGISDASSTGIFISGGSGNVTDNTLDDGFDDLLYDALSDPVLDFFVVKLRYRFGM